MATIKQIETIDALREQGIVGLLSEDLQSVQVPAATEKVKEYIGLYKNPTLTTTTETSEGEEFHTCTQLDSVIDRTGQLNFDYYTVKNPILFNRIFGEGSFTIVTGATASVVGETATVAYSVDDGVFLVALEQIDYANPIVQGLAVTNVTTAAAMVLGTDYTITRYNSKTAIVTIPGGGISEGDQLSFNYDYDPLVSVKQIIGAKSSIVQTNDWFIRTNVNGVDIEDQDKIVEVTILDGKVTSEIVLAWVSCDNDQDALTPLPITVESQKGSGVCIETFQR